MVSKIGDTKDKKQVCLKEMDKTVEWKGLHYDANKWMTICVYVF